MIESRARGTFEVKLTPASEADAVVGRLTIAKTFYGDLQGMSVGEMLAVGTATDGSAGYVAMESVTGTLAGRPGSFALQHSGTMNRGTSSLTICVVPDSGADGLKGLSGEMSIEVVDGQHKYEFTYALPE